MELVEIIRELSAVNGPSGFEESVSETAAALLQPYCDEIKTDAMGSLIAVRHCGKPDAKRLMLDAHMDEIGFIVTGYEKGFLRFSMLGGVDPRMLPARDVLVLTQPPVCGVIDTMPPHVLSAEDMDKSVKADKLFIDVGLTQEDAKKLIPLGTPVVFAGNCEMMGENQLCGKALDDRSCVAIIIKAMELLAEQELNVDVCCLISTQEELGLRGAAPGAFAICPDMAIALDVTHARTPDVKKEEALELGKGAAIGVGPNMNRTLTETIIQTAEKREIPYQLEVIPGRSGTNAWAIQISREGVPTALMSLPVKYMHSPVETGDIRDAQAITDLLSAYISEIGKETANA